MSVCQPILTGTTAYQAHGVVDPSMIQTWGPVPSHASSSYAPLQFTQALTGHTDLFACDDPSVVAQYLQYTPLQPTRTILGVQPSTIAEEMLYPETPSRSQCLSSPEGLLGTGFGLQGHDELAESRDSNTGMVSALATTATPPPLSHRTTYGDAPAHYDTVHGRADPDSLLTGGPEVLEMPARSDFGVVYNPHQRTPSARRGPFKDHEKREKTAHTRRIGSCIRCRMQRIRVSLSRTRSLFPPLGLEKEQTLTAI